MSLKVVLYGYYGVGELCDDFMADATKKTFEELSDRPIEWVAPNVKPDLVVLGGGSLLGTNLYLEQFCNLVQHWDCPVAIFGTGARDVERGDFLPGLRYLWQRASSISVRGETSRKRLEQWGLDTSKIESLGDPIFLSEPSRLEKQGYIGGVIRPTPNTYPDWMKRSLTQISGLRLEPVKLFSFCEAQGDGASNKSAGCDSYVLDGRQTRQAIAKSSFWFGNRLHAFCLALIEGVPAIGVEVEFMKVEDVCSTLNYPFWIYPLQGAETAYMLLTSKQDYIHDATQLKIATIAQNLRSQAREILTLAN